MLRLLCLLLLLVVPASARLPRSKVAVVQDPEGYCNARSGPGTDFPVQRRIPAGEHVMVQGWPYPGTREELKKPHYSGKLAKLCKQPGRIFEWRWVISLERNPKRGVGESHYLHQSRLRVVREDAVNWGCIIDPGGYLNVRSGPGSNSEVVGKLKRTECFIVLDQPAYDGLKWPSAGLMTRAAAWTRVIKRDGVVGWVSSSRIRLHDPRDWQFDGPIPYVL